MSDSWDNGRDRNSLANGLQRRLTLGPGLSFTSEIFTDEEDKQVYRRSILPSPSIAPVALTFLSLLTLTFFAHRRQRRALGKGGSEGVHANAAENGNCGGGSGDI